MPAELCLVTGVSGFVGLHVAKAALAAGFKVRGTVRSIDRHRASILAAAPGIELRELDLVGATDAAWAEAAAGCAVCCHVASPFPVVTPKDEQELIVPAVDGTKKVLAACKAAGIRRVVVTSSIAAVSSGLGSTGRTEFSAADWSDVEGCEAYPKSKTLAERAARSYGAEHELEVSTVNPSYVQGPVLQARENSSTKMCLRMLAGDMPAVPAIGMNICDVRDVADAHVAALDPAVPAGGRFIVDSGPVLMTEVAKTLASEFPNYPVKTRAAP